MVKLEVKDLTKKFSDTESYDSILENINMSFNEGEFVCILGNTGCGKTTLLRILSGFESPSSGEVLFDGEKYDTPSKKVIIFFQDANQLFPWKRLIDNVAYPMLVSTTKNRKEVFTTADGLLNLVELGEYKKFYPHQLSGGMKQRGILARALAMSPDVMMFDEPFSSLDEITRSKLQTLLLKIHAKSRFLSIFVTHSIGEAMYLADRIIVMGKAPNNVLKIYNNPYKGSHHRDAGYTTLLEEIRCLMGKYPKES